MKFRQKINWKIYAFERLIKKIKRRIAWEKNLFLQKRRSARPEKEGINQSK